MPFPPCDNKSNPHNRKNLVTQYTIIPVAHTMLLPGQDLKGCCGAIRTECYTFSYVKNFDPTDSGLFSVGRSCGKSFILLTGEPAPPLFNPLASQPTAAVGQGASPGNGQTTAGAQRMCPLNQEVYQAVNLLILSWGTPKEKLQSILTAVVTQPTSAISSDSVCHLNSIIGMDRKQRTLSQMLSELQAIHPRLRAFSFPLINSVLVAAGRTSNF